MVNGNFYASGHCSILTFACKPHSKFLCLFVSWSFLSVGFLGRSYNVRNNMKLDLPICLHIASNTLKGVTS